MSVAKSFTLFPESVTALINTIFIPVDFNTQEDEIAAEVYEKKMRQLLQSGIINNGPDIDVTTGDAENVRQQILDVRQSDVSHLKLARRAIEMALEKTNDESDRLSDNRFVNFEMSENGCKARVLFPGNSRQNSDITVRNEKLKGKNKHIGVSYDNSSMYYAFSLFSPL